MVEQITQTALALPDEAQFRQDIQAINRFQAIVHQNLVSDQDYGIIPGTTKPTLLKPGAEKIAKLLGLSDQYEIVDRQEDWNKAFFRYLVKCKLIHVISQSLISEGLGECNSMESKYRWRWLSERDLPAGIDKTKLIAQERTAKTGGHWTVFRFENDDIYAQVNTILKMAKKRALVDAALSAGRLSNVFTQDMEDIESIRGDIIEKPAGEAIDKSNHWCAQHSTSFFKKGKMKSYAHPIEGTDKWCHESEKAKATTPIPDEQEESEPPSEMPPEATGSTIDAIQGVTGGIDADWLNESIKTLQSKKLKAWTDEAILAYMKKMYKVEADTWKEAVTMLDIGKAKHFATQVADSLDMA